MGEILRGTFFRIRDTHLQDEGHSFQDERHSSRSSAAPYFVPVKFLGAWTHLSIISASASPTTMLALFSVVEAAYDSCDRASTTWVGVDQV